MQITRENGYYSTEYSTKINHALIYKYKKVRTESITPYSMNKLSGVGDFDLYAVCPYLLVELCCPFIEVFRINQVLCFR